MLSECLVEMGNMIQPKIRVVSLALMITSFLFFVISAVTPWTAITTSMSIYLFIPTTIHTPLGDNTTPSLLSASFESPNLIDNFTMMLFLTGVVFLCIFILSRNLQKSGSSVLLFLAGIFTLTLPIRILAFSNTNALHYLSVGFYSALVTSILTIAAATILFISRTKTSSTPESPPPPPPPLPPI